MSYKSTSKKVIMCLAGGHRDRAGEPGEDDEADDDDASAHQGDDAAEPY